MKTNRKKSIKKTIFIIALSLLGVVLVSSYPAYMIARYAFNRYFDDWGNKLVDLEKRGLLSKEYGAGWQDVLTDQAMKNEAQRITAKDTLANQNAESNKSVKVVDGVVLEDYPSLSILARLIEVREYSNTIRITDRLGRDIASIKTDHQRARFNEFPKTLTTALLAAEDQKFRENKMGFEFDSFARAFIRSALQTLISFHRTSPRGTSTITQQVAKLFISRLDETGKRLVSHTVDRKVRELRLAVALRKMYTPDQILEVYMNHCVTSDYGMIGYKDIAKGLFKKDLNQLTDAQCIYLARMVKWGRNVKPKIVAQCKVDMPRMGAALGWDKKHQKKVLAEIEGLTFARPKTVQGNYGPLVDLANEFWLLTLRKEGSNEDQCLDMDLIDPNSLVRKKGNLDIKLTIDLGLQQQLEKLVNSRGYGRDTTILTEVRIGSTAGTVTMARPPRDTLRALKVLRQQVDFREPELSYTTRLNSGDSVYLNVRYKDGDSKKEYRRSCFYYVRKPRHVDGQYFAYSIMDSRTGKLLAYYSRDQLGSRLACLLKNSTPNGSSTAKPILNALNFDIGTFQPYSRWTDSVQVRDNVPWSRTMDYTGNKLIGVVFDQSAVRGQGYHVHNHLGVFEGCQYVFDLLSTSNNILGVETVYRLNRKLFAPDGNVQADAFPLVQYFSRIGAFSRVKDSLNLKTVTGVRAYKELARIVGIDIDSITSYGKRVPVSDSQYSIALGTMEMNLYQQMHMFNVLYNNDLIERPAEHPSLVIESIVLNGDTVPVNDTIRRYHPFDDINNLRPTYLGLHKRLVSNRADGLTEYDIPWQGDTTSPIYNDKSFHKEAYPITEPLSNIAKSGTTDDVIIPFNVDPSSTKRTNYGLWNAVIRLDFSKFTRDTSADVRDITVACIGECNDRYTGVRDGKTLHKFVTAGLLHAAGIKEPRGYYDRYEAYVRRTTPASELCGAKPSESKKPDQTSLPSKDNLGD